MTTSRQELVVQLSHDIARLTKPFNHQEKADGRSHHSRHASLLDQLEEELIDSTPNLEGKGSKQTSGSKPPVREEIAVLIWDAERTSIRLVDLAGGKSRGNTSDNLQALNGLTQNVDDKVLGFIVSEVASLKGQIETQLTWELRPRRLSGSCPVCNKSGGLVVQMDSYGPTSARCQKCQSFWAKEVLGLLAGGLQTPKQPVA